MDAQSLTIEHKHRRPFEFLASLDDFTCSAGAAVDPSIVVEHPGISLYCLDDATQRAIFVELPPEVDLTTAPFVLLTQYEQAQRLVAMPYATFRRLGHALPAIAAPILIYSTGRSGSTLLSHLLNAVEGAVSLSEPDVATQFIHLRPVPGAEEAGLCDLLDCTVRFLFKPSAFGPRSAHALKFRSYALSAMDLYQATFPQARNLFLYRDALSTVASYTRLLRRAGMAERQPISGFLSVFGQVLARDLTPLTTYLPEGTRELSLPQQLALMWLDLIEMYLAHHAQGIPALAVHYDDLNARRERVAAAILAYCGLPPLPATDLQGVFGRDAQAGTVLAREDAGEGNPLRLSPEERRQVEAIVQRHPTIKSGDFRVPGTLRVSDEAGVHRRG